MASNLNDGIPSFVGISLGHVEESDDEYTKAVMEAWGLSNSVPLRPGKAQAAVGVVKNAVVRDDILYGDYHVPKRLAAVMKATGQGYLTTSPELGRPKVASRWFGPQGRTVKGPVILGVALLGSVQPAFTIQAGLEHTANLSMDTDEDDGIFRLDGQSNWTMALGPSMHRDGPLGQGDEEMPGTDAINADNPLGTDLTRHEKYDLDFKNIEGGNKEDMDYSKQFEMMGRMMATFAEGQTAMLSEITNIKTTMAAREEASFLTNMEAHAENWAHLSAEERIAEVAIIREMHVVAPDAATVLMARNNKFGSMFAAQASLAGHDDDSKDDDKDKDKDDDKKDDDKSDMSANPNALTPGSDEFESQSTLGAANPGETDKDMIDDINILAAKLSEENGLPAKDNFSRAMLQYTATPAGKKKMNEQIQPSAQTATLGAAV